MSVPFVVYALTAIIPLVSVNCRAQQTESQTPPSGVSRVPPGLYEERLKPHLTTLEKVQAIPKSPVDPDGDTRTETLLDETIVFVKDDGSEIKAAHQIRQVLSEAGAKQLAEAGHFFRPSTSRIHLPVAHTIRADGTIIPVEEKGAFIKRPANDQPQLHSDYEELRIVFPEVAKGAIVEEVVVWDTFRPTVAGAFLHSQLWGNDGPTRRFRIFFNLSEAMRAKLQWHALGVSLREPEESKLADGRVALQWAADHLPPVEMETGGPPPRQVGPHVRMGTVADWKEFGTWFAGLLKDGETPSEEVAAKAAEWIGEAKSPEEIARKLYERVSIDVRYTGLEFGTGAYQPRSPAEVLATRYGDCKDKANLLREVLAQSGIRSRLALLDADHAGEIDRAIPSPGRFTHAILAIDLAGGDEPLWCDPTQEGVPIGLLGPGDTDRDVLLVDANGEVEWRHTPSQSLGRQEATFDFQLEPGGGFSGWLTIEGEGVLPSRLHHVLSKSDRPNALKRLAAIYCGEMKGADVVDYELTSVDRPGKVPSIKLRMYVLKLGSSIDDKPANEQVRFPAVGMMSPKVGPKAERHSALLGTVFEFRARGILRAPTGWKVLDLPGPLKREAAGFRVSASWAEKKGVLTCESAATATKALIHPSDHRALFELARELGDWLGSPAILKRPAVARIRTPNPDDEDGEAAAEPRRWTPKPESLPRLITPQGQLALVDKRYPIDPQNPFEADNASRRKALAKLLEYFPNDSNAQYQAGVALLASDILDFEFDDISTKANALIEKYRASLDANSLATGELILATGLALKGKEEEARPLLLAIADNGELNGAIRTPAAVLASGIVEKDDPERALSLARQALDARFLPADAAATVATLDLESLARLEKTQVSDLLLEMDAILRKHSAHAAALRSAYVNLPESMLDAGYFPACERLLAALEELSKAPGFDEDDLETFQDAKSTLAKTHQIIPLRDKVLGWLDEHPWPDLDKIETDDELDLVSDVSDAIEEKTADVALRYSLRRLVRYGPQPEFAEHLVAAAEAAERYVQKFNTDSAALPKPSVDLEALLDAFVAFAREVPPNDESTAVSLVKLEGKLLHRRQGVAAALAFYRSKGEEDSAPKSVRAAGHESACDLLCTQGQYAVAAGELRALEKIDADEISAYLTLRGVYLNLLSDNTSEAWRWMERLTQDLPEDGSMFSLKALQQETAKLLRDRPAAEQWWRQTSSWWKEWEGLSKRAKLDAPEYAGILSPLDWSERSSTGAVKEILAGKRDKSASELLWRELTKARWHRSSAESAAAALRELGPVVSKQHAGEFRALAVKVSPPRRKR